MICEKDFGKVTFGEQLLYVVLVADARRRQLIVGNSTMSNGAASVGRASKMGGKFEKINETREMGIFERLNNPFLNYL